MRIEKINDKQIRCTLNQKDLSDRELRISELAYGTDKAKALFRDMMQQASYEYGFEAENIPLMIEAIPMYPDTLILVVTKVEDPDELDTRFSRFSNEDPDEIYDEYEYEEEDEDEDDEEYSEVLYNPDLSNYNEEDSLTLPSMMNQSDSIDFTEDGLILRTADKNPGDDFISLSEALGMERRPKHEDGNLNTASPSAGSRDLADVSYCFSFRSLDTVTQLAETLVYEYQGQNTLYKDSRHDIYYLVIHRNNHTLAEFNHIINTLREYGTQKNTIYASEKFYEEHFTPIIRDKALQVLASI